LAIIVVACTNTIPVFDGTMSDLTYITTNTGIYGSIYPKILFDAANPYDVYTY